MTGEALPLLIPLSWLYRGAAALHDRLYRAGILRAQRLPEPVISLGNLAVGGTGKTPATIWLAGRLRDRGLRPVILTRGHGRRSGQVVLVTPGKPRPDFAEAGDEPLEMAAALRDVPVAISADRCAGAVRARGPFRPDLFLLDDGFQHRPLLRDLDIVLLDAAQPFGNGRCLPAGILREPPGALRRADVVVLTRAERVVAPEHALAHVARHLRPGVPIFLAEHRCVGVVPLADILGGEAAPANEGRGPAPVAGVEVVAAAGIASPESFCATVESAGFRVSRLVSFPDHHSFGARDVARVEEAAAGRPILTTAKDAVRWLARMGRARAGWWVVRLAFAPRDPEALLEAILVRLAAARAKTKGAEA